MALSLGKDIIYYMIMQNTPFILLTATIALLFTGCLEHRYNISVVSDRRISIDYKLSGDRADMEDGNEILPDSTTWNLTRSVEETEEKTTHIVEGRFLVSDEAELGQALNWRKSSADSLYFTPELSLESHWTLFGRVWLMDLKIESRRFIELYGDIWEYVPPECRALEDDDLLRELPESESAMLERKFGLGVIQWNRNRYERLFTRVWEKSIQKGAIFKDTTEATREMIEVAWESDIHSYLNELDVGDPQTANLLWWGDLRPLFLGRFADIADTQQLDLIGATADAIDTDYKISKDMEDDNFIFRIKLPGWILKADGERDGGELVWEVNGKEFMNDGVTLHAKSFSLSSFQVSLGILVLFGVVILVTRRSASSSRKTMHEIVGR
jgi:hypothetical protein